jgi:hypothetical protein
MAGTFTRATFYKLDTSPNARVEYTGVYDAVSPYTYRITNQATGGVIYAGGAALGITSPDKTTVQRLISPSGGTALSPTWPTTAGSPVTIWVQENIKGAGFLSPATSSAVVLAITNPAVSGTQTFATTAAATISHSPALSTTGAGGTLQYNATTSATYSSSGWTTSTSPVILTRGTSYYLWARRGVGVSTEEGAFSVSNGPFTVPYLSPNVTLGTVSPAGLELTGGNTSDVSVNWTTQTNHTYQIIRNDLSSPALVVSETSSPRVTLFYSQSSSPVGSPNSGLVDLPLEGKTANYTIEVKRSVASGGDGLWYAGTGTNHPFNIVRIQNPTVRDTQTFNGSSPTPISCTIDLKVSGVGGTLEYGWSTLNTSPGAVTNWQSSPTFVNAFARGSTYYFYARRSTDASDYDVSAAIVVPSPRSYGLKVWNSNGSKVLLDPSFNPCNLVSCKISGVAATNVTVTGGTTSASIDAPGITSSNGDTMFIYVYPLGGPPAFVSGWYSVNRSTDSFTITSSVTATFYFFVGRIV